MCKDERPPYSLFEPYSLFDINWPAHLYMPEPQTAMCVVAPHKQAPPFCDCRTEGRMLHGKIAAPRCKVELAPAGQDGLTETEPATPAARPRGRARHAAASDRCDSRELRQREAVGQVARMKVAQAHPPILAFAAPAPDFAPQIHEQGMPCVTECRGCRLESRRLQWRAVRLQQPQQRHPRLTTPLQPCKRREHPSAVDAAVSCTGTSLVRLRASPAHSLLHTKARGHLYHGEVAARRRRPSHLRAAARDASKLLRFEVTQHVDCHVVNQEDAQ